jgi:hypothetical protein
MMRKEMVELLILAMLSLSSDVLAQELPMRVKGGHQLGETAEQFFAEGHEKDVLSACAKGDFKSVNSSGKRQAKKYCSELTDTRQLAISGKRGEYHSDGDPSEMRTDTFTFDGGHLVKVELLYSVPSAESNYSGHSFEEIFAGVKQAYGPPTSESTEQKPDVFGVQLLAHRELWVAPHAAILITEQPWQRTTTLVAFTRAEYDRTMEVKPANPLE